jgi:hypothetical protein
VRKPRKPRRFRISKAKIAAFRASLAECIHDEIARLDMVAVRSMAMARSIAIATPTPAAEEETK